MAQLLDLFTTAISYLVTIYVWKFLYSHWSTVVPAPTNIQTDTYYLIFLLSVSSVILFQWQNAYSYQRYTSLTTTIAIVSKVDLLLLVLGIGLFFIFGYKTFPRTFFLISVPTFFIVFTIQKSLLFAVAYWIREKGKDRKRIILVGTGSRAENFIKVVHKNFGWGLDIVGLVTGDIEKVGTVIHGIKVIGTFGDIEKILHEINPEEVIITVSTKRFTQLRDVLETCEREGVQVRLNSDFFGHIVKHVRVDNVFGLNIISFNMTRHTELELIAKRAIDIIGSLIAILLFSPFMFIAAIGVWLSAGRPILYSWHVFGKNKKPLTSWKFRTMVLNADELKECLNSKNEMNGPVFKIKDDPRVFSFGRWLRKWSIDETPQLFSVIKGDMSLVGPRPAGLDELPNYESWQRRRLSVKPGLTCIWQVRGRNGISNFNEWVNLDLEYIDNWSLWLDIKLLCQTIPAVITKKGAS
jgi:exopolysaccharide biosynthesis polyprenyl glycosylphosphotransferase